MKQIVVLSVVLMATFLWIANASADTAQDCRSLVERAVSMFKDQDKAAALKAIDSKTGPFVNGDLYVFAITTTDNVVLAHPYEKTLKRMKMENFKDSNGKHFFKEFREVAVNGGSGWVEYTWAKPGTKEASPKRAYIMKVPGEDIYVGSGYYLK